MRLRDVCRPLLLILGCSLAVRLVYCTHNGLWFDEAIVLHRISQGLTTMLRMIRTGDETPPGHYLLLYPYIHLLGTRPQWIAELPSVLISLFGILYVYRVGAEMFSRETGLFAALFLACSSYYLKFSWEIRVYALLASVSLASMYYFLRFTREPGSWPAFAKFTAAAALNLYSHYFAFLVLLVQNTYVVAFHFAPAWMGGEREREREREPSPGDGSWRRECSCSASCPGFRPFSSSSPA